MTGHRCATCRRSHLHLACRDLKFRYQEGPIFSELQDIQSGFRSQKAELGGCEWMRRMEDEPRDLADYLGNMADLPRRRA